MLCCLQQGTCLTPWRAGAGGGLACFCQSWGAATQRCCNNPPGNRPSSPKALQCFGKSCFPTFPASLQKTLCPAAPREARVSIAVGAGGSLGCPRDSTQNHSSGGSLGLSALLHLLPGPIPSFPSSLPTSEVRGEPRHPQSLQHCLHPCCKEERNNTHPPERGRMDGQMDGQMERYSRTETNQAGYT